MSTAIAAFATVLQRAQSHKWPFTLPRALFGLILARCFWQVIRMIIGRCVSFLTVITLLMAPALSALASARAPPAVRLLQRSVLFEVLEDGADDGWGLRY